MSRWTPPRSRAALALLAPTTSGTRSLVVGPGAWALLEAIRGFGGDVLLLRPPRAPPEGEEVQGTIVARGRSLPLHHGAFHSVFLDGSPAALGRALGLAGKDPGATLLRECRRLLAPGGTLVMAVPNRFGVHRLRARLRIKGGDAKLHQREPRSSRAYHGLLRRVGFDRPEVHLPWPSHDSLNLLIPGNALRREVKEALERGLFGEGKGTLGMRASARILQVVGPRGWIFSHFYVVARLPQRRQTPPPHSPLDLLLADFRHVAPSPSHGERGRRPILAYRSQSATALIGVGDWLTKVPLFPSMVKRLRREVDAVRRLKPTLGARVPDGMGIREHDGFVYAASPRVPCDASLEPESRLQQALDALHRTAEQGRLVETGVWETLEGLNERGTWAMLGVPDLYETLAARVEDVQLPVGLLHGDFKPENILSRGGDVVLIDWDGFDPRAPLVLDVIHAVVTRLQSLQVPKPGLDARISALFRIRRGDPTVPFLREIRRLQGELHPAEATCLYVMHYVSRADELLVAGSLPRSLERRFRRYLQFSRFTLLEGGTLPDVERR